MHVRDGLEALILRPQFYELVELCEERETGGEVTLGLWSDGAYFELGRIGDDADHGS